MAPVMKRNTARAKAAKARSSSKPAAAAAAAVAASSDEAALFTSTKRDKRTIKHSTFVNRIEKANSKTKKRRRPNKQLAANLESLADALPDVDDEQTGHVEVGQATIQRKSLKTRPGAMKRKDKLEKVEKDRFNKNLAQLATINVAGSTHTLSDRWAALKNHVQSTAEKKAEFIKP